MNEEHPGESIFDEAFDELNTPSRYSLLPGWVKFLAWLNIVLAIWYAVAAAWKLLSKTDLLGYHPPVDYLGAWTIVMMVVKFLGAYGLLTYRRFGPRWARLDAMGTMVMVIFTFDTNMLSWEHSITILSRAILFLVALFYFYFNNKIHLAWLNARR